MRTRRLFHGLVATVALSASGACATIAHGTRQDIRITSEPIGATVFIGSTAAGPTPAVVNVKRNSPLTIRFEKDGYEPLHLPVKRSVSGWVAADAIALNPFSCQGLKSASACPGLILANVATFFGIDFLSGAAFKFPREVNGVLTPRK